MSKPQYRYALQDSNGNYYQLTSDKKNVIAGTSPYYFDNQPMDESDMRYSLERRLDSTGLFRQDITPTKFAGDAAKILRFIFYTGTYEAAPILIVERLNATTQNYERYARIAIDNSKTIDEVDKYHIVVTPFDSGIAEWFKANENTTFAIPADNRYSENLLNDGVSFYNRVVWVVYDGAGKDPAKNHVLDMEKVYTESQNELDTRSVEWQEWDSGGDFDNNIAATGKYFYKSTTNEDVIFKYDFTVNFDPISSPSYSLYAPVVVLLRRRGGVNTAIYKLLDLTTPTPVNSNVYLNTIYTLQGEITISNQQVGDEYYLTAQQQPTPPDTGRLFFLYGGALRVELIYRDRLPVNEHEVTNWFKAFLLLMETASGGKYTAVSDFLTKQQSLVQWFDNQPLLTYLTSGDAIRNKANAKMRLSLADMLKDARSNWGVVPAIEGDKIRLEPLKYFLNKNNVILTINEENITNFKTSVASELLVSHIEVGYSAQVYDAVNGRQEFNGSHTYKLPVERSGAKLDLKTPFRADSIGIEVYRKEIFYSINADELEDKETVDNEDDGGIFIFALEPTIYSYPIPPGGKYRKVQRWGATNVNGKVTGLLSPETVYNVGESPKRRLYRNLPDIISRLHAPNSGQIEFASGEQNTDMQSSLAGIHIVENSDLQLSHYNSLKLYYPRYIEFDTILQGSVIAQLAGNPHGVVRVILNGNAFDGFLIKVESQNIERRTNVYSFKLLMSPNFNFSLFLEAMDKRGKTRIV